ncbi:MAG: hypothetical protein A3B70_03545 [Deltaproteobacteria bacterium RIFCSPHIGHO2_02_FULL_40_11]|nr:MAG: hypothetical protein A3B70_03545 [Deltaproteobacteria bacterium RIFCSPHIGHO2_02_FULL_40_11]
MKKLFLFVVLISCVTWAADLPHLSGPVVDEAGMLSSPQKRALALSIQQFYQQTGYQIQVVTIESLKGDVLEDFSMRLAEKWKIGNKETGSGVILLITKQERKIRIEVGDGIEGELTDLQASRIIRGMIAPAFKQNNYAAGIASGVQAIASALGGEVSLLNTPHFQKTPTPVNGLGYFIFILIWFLLILPFFFKGKKLRGRRLLFAMFLASLLGSGRRGSGFGGSSFGGSGFGGGWSGGGGGFSGGGASGGW